MNKIYIPLASMAYLFFISLGTISVIDISWAPFQILIGVALISCSFFIIVNIKSIKKICIAIRENKITSTKMALYVLLMLIPIFITEKHGISPVFYTLVFSSTFAALTYLLARRYIKSFILFCLIICFFIFDNNNKYGYLVLMGPISAYFLLINTKKLSKKACISTSQIMLIRYALLTLICLPLLPIADFDLSKFNSHDISTILMISIFLNIIPIYCSQYIALTKDPDYLGKVTSMVPFTVFVIYLIFYNSNSLTLTEAVFSITLSVIMLIYFIKGKRS